MANNIPPLISSSPPPLCECEDEDDDEFGMFTGVEDIDFTGKLCKLKNLNYEFEIYFVTDKCKE